MRKLSVLLVLTLICSMFAVSVSAAPAVDGRKTITAYVADVKVDGVVDDCWVDASIVYADIVKENASAWFGDSSKQAGVDYATLAVKALWDGDSTLYLLYSVTDQLLSYAGANPWERDSIEVFLQFDNEAEDSSASKQQVRWFADGNIEGDNSYILEYAFAPSAGGFMFEIAVDVSEVIDGNYLGIDFQYNDDAEGEGVRNVCLGWSDEVDAASSNCTVYGQCELSSTNVAEITAARVAAEQAAADAAAAEDAADGAADEAGSAPATADMGIVGLAVLMSAAAVVLVKSKKN